MHLPRKTRLISLCLTAAATVLSGCSAGALSAPPLSVPPSQSGSSIAADAAPPANSTSMRRNGSSTSHVSRAFQSALPYQQAVLADSPNVFYPLNDTTSSVVDAAGSHINGSYGSLVSHSGPSLVADNTASASFPGGTYNTSAFAEVAPATNLTPSPNLSLEMWIELNKANTTGVQVPVVAYGQGSGPPYKIELATDDTLRWRIHGPASNVFGHVAGRTVLSLGTPHHIVATFDGSTLLLYVDGALDGSQAAPGPIDYSGQNGTDGLTIGAEVGHMRPTFAGDIAEVAVYPSILSASQITAHYKVGSGRMATPGPSASPTASASASPTPTSSGSPTATPSASPTAMPSASPTARPSGTPIPNGVTENPKSVYSFAGSIGYDAHLTWKSTIYFTDWSGLRPLFLGSGASNLRATAGNNETVRGRLADLCANGIKHTVDFLIDDTPATITSTINWYGPACVDGVEPANEYDAVARDPANPDSNWVAHIIAAQRTLYNTIKSNPQFSGITVMGPSMSNSLNYAKLGNLESISDVGNQHWSNCDGSPMTTHYKNIVRSLAYVRAAYPTEPIWTTETANGDLSQYGCFLPDSVIAKYQPRTFLERFNLGQPQTFIFEFADVPSKGAFGDQGVVTSSGNAKLQYTAIKSLVTAVGGRDVPYKGSPLTYSMTGSTANLQHTLLQGSDGKYRLVLWLEVDSWDTSSHVVINVPAQTVTLNLPSSVRSAAVATSNPDFTMSTRTVPVSGGAVRINVTDSPSVVSF